MHSFGFAFYKKVKEKLVREEPHKKIRVAGESSLHILKSTGREGIARGTMEKIRGCFLVLGV